MQARVLIAGDVVAARARRVDRLQCARCRARRRTVARGEVRDLQRHFGAAADIERLVESLHGAKVAIARVDGVVATESSSGAGEHHQLVGRTRQAERILQPGREAKRSVIKGFAQESNHPVELGRRRRPRRTAKRPMWPTSVATFTAGRARSTARK